LVAWPSFCARGCKIREKVKSLFFCNLRGEMSQMYVKSGVKSLVAKSIDLGWFGLSQVGWISFF